MQTLERASKLYGVMVVALEEGLRMGRVSDVYFDTQAKKIMGISHKRSLWGGDKEIYVAFEDIIKFSRDVVIVSAQAAARELPAEHSRCALRTLKGYKITTDGGRHIAELSDLMIDRQDGRITQILLPDDKKLKIDIADVHLGPDLIMVPGDYEPVIEPMEHEQNDFIDRIFGNAAFSETFRQGVEGVRSSVRNNKNTEKVVQTLRSSSRKARDTVLRTSQAIQQTLDQMMRKREAEKRDQEEEADVITPVDVNSTDTQGQPDTTDVPEPQPPPDGEETQNPKNDGQT